MYSSKVRAAAQPRRKRAHEEGFFEVEAPELHPAHQRDGKSVGGKTYRNYEYL